MEPVVVLPHPDLREHLLDELLVGLGTTLARLFFLPTIVPDESDVGAPTMYAFLMTRAQILHRSSFSFFENPGSSASTCFKARWYTNTIWAVFVEMASWSNSPSSQVVMCRLKSFKSMI